MSVFLLAAALVATPPVRNPFWPVGYEGTYREISSAPRIQSRPNAEKKETPSAPSDETDAEALARVANEENIRRSLAMSGRWEAARQTLRFGGVFGLGEEGATNAVSAVLINGRACSVGDVIRVDHDGYSFTWRVVRSTNEHQLTLNRIKAVRLDERKERERK